MEDLEVNPIGFTSASEQLLDDVDILLTEIEIEYRKEKWLNKKYDKYYGLIILLWINNKKKQLR